MAPPGASPSIEHGDRVPAPGDNLEAVVAAGFATEEQAVLVELGLIPCQVQDGELVLLGGPGTEGNVIRTPMRQGIATGSAVYAVTMVREAAR